MHGEVSDASDQRPPFPLGHTIERKAPPRIGPGAAFGRFENDLDLRQRRSPNVPDDTPDSVKLPLGLETRHNSQDQADRNQQAPQRISVHN